MSFMPPVKKPKSKSKPSFNALGKDLGVLQRKCDCGSGAGSGRECESCAKKKVVQRKAESPAKPASTPSPVAQTLRSAGKPLDAGTKSFMESRFGHDFSQVRVHTDSQAAQSAKSVQAHAYTVGQNIAFAQGKYAPETSHGKKLLAHELAHTVQQRGLQRSADNLSGLSDSQDKRYESEADRTADRVVGMASPLKPIPMPITRTGGPTLSRKKDLGKTLKFDLDGNKYEADQVEADPEAYDVNPLYVPAEKGDDGITRYEDAVSAGTLQTVFDLKKDKVASWQKRDSTDAMKKTWLSARNIIDSKEADTKWKTAGGKKEFPSTKDGTCQMDHIIELQLQGGNNAENIQPLNQSPNATSGSNLRVQIMKISEEIENSGLHDKKKSQIQLRFRSTKPYGSFKQKPVKGKVPNKEGS